MKKSEEGKNIDRPFDRKPKNKKKKMVMGHKVLVEK
jgi:hypothetical protein